VYWVCFGYSGNVEEPQGLVIENYMQSDRFNYHVKSIENPRAVVRMFNHHLPVLMFGKSTYNTMGRTLKWHYDPNITDTDSKEIRINHYTTKSHERLAKKIERQKKAASTHGMYYIEQPGLDDVSFETWREWTHFRTVPLYNDSSISRFVPIIKQSLSGGA
jgi:hypothetical protein